MSVNTSCENCKKHLKDSYPLKNQSGIFYCRDYEFDNVWWAFKHLMIR